MLKKSLITIILLVLISIPLFSITHEQELINTIETLINSNEELIERVELLEKENKEYIENEKVLREKLKESNTTILQLSNVIKQSSEEISLLRDTIKKVSAKVDKDKNFSVGVGASYPLGGSVLFSARPKNFPVGGFIDVNINTTTGAFVSVGAIYSF